MAQLPHHRLGSLRLGHGFRQGLGFPYCLKSIIRNLRSWMLVHRTPSPFLCIVHHTYVALVFPGAIFIIGSWYRQYETARRVSLFYMAALLASGFAPIVSLL